jgi:hypothetical protein
MLDGEIEKKTKFEIKKISYKYEDQSERRLSFILFIATVKIRILLVYVKIKIKCLKMATDKSAHV